MWKCPKCETKVDPSFDVCWNCGTTADGIEDPTFVKADDAEPIEGGLVPELAVRDEPIVVGELPEPYPDDLVEAYRALDLMEATFLADQLKDAGIPAVADTQDLHDALGGMTSGPRVRVALSDLPLARSWLEEYERNKVAPTDHPTRPPLGLTDFIP